MVHQNYEFVNHSELQFGMVNVYSKFIFRDWLKDTVRPVVNVIIICPWLLCYNEMRLVNKACEKLLILCRGFICMADMIWPPSASFQITDSLKSRQACKKNKNFLIFAV